MVKRPACLSVCQVMLVVGWMMLAWHNAAQAQTVTVDVSSSSIDLNTGLTAEFKLTGLPDVPQPDWSSLTRDFQILNRNQMRTMRIINGRQISMITWKLELMPKRAGRLTIPALKFGTLLSQAKVIQVKKPPPQPSRAKSDIYLEATIEPKNVYVQQQALLVIKVFMAKNLNGNITQPQANLQTIIEGLGNAKEYRVNQHGKMYQVYERHYTLFPQASGELIVQAGHLTGSYIESNRRVGVNKKVAVIKAKVSAIPDQFSGSVWMPAGDVTLKQKWSGDIRKWEQGKPLTRTIYLSAAGLLPSQLPVIEPPDTPNFNVYVEPNPNLNKSFAGKNVIGTREQKFVFIPRREGEHQLPEIKMPWWNTGSDRMEYAVVPAMAVQVIENRSGLLSDEEEAAGGSATIIEMSPAESGGVLSEAGGGYSSVWFWTSIALGSGWFLTLVLLLYRGGVASAVRRIVSRRIDLRKATKQLKAACLSEKPERVRERLLQWGQLVWTDTPPRTLGQLAALCGEKLAVQIRRLNEAIYGKGEWRRADLLWQAVEQEPAVDAKMSASDKPAGDSGLEPLHRLD